MKVMEKVSTQAGLRISDKRFFMPPTAEATLGRLAEGGGVLDGLRLAGAIRDRDLDLSMRPDSRTSGESDDIRL